jgi:hypothetical protein
MVAPEPDCIGGVDVTNEFWMPMPAAAPVGLHAFVYERLTQHEQQLLRRLRRGTRLNRRTERWTEARKQRAARRQRRRALANLSINDVRVLLRLVEELGL